MSKRLVNLANRLKLGALAAALAVGGLALSQPAPAAAHCDSTNGPVVGAAQRALEAGDVKPVLAYVQAADEPELTAAFRHSLDVRALGPEARELADRYFFETAVRLHRQGEGAPYTGLKEIADVGPALSAADRALQNGDVDAVYAVLARTLASGLEDKYHAVLEARERAAREGTVAADRERAEAELLFEKYVEELYQAALGGAQHVEPAAAPHAH
jgi:hypothetical protein